MYMKASGQGCERNSTDRLQLLQEALSVLSQCAAILRASQVTFEDHALDMMVAHIGSRLVQMGLGGDDVEYDELVHWRDHGLQRCKELIEKAHQHNGVITWGDVHTMWLKPPGPRIKVLDNFAEYPIGIKVKS